MKVKELIHELQALPQEAVIVLTLTGFAGTLRSEDESVHCDGAGMECVILSGASAAFLDYPRRRGRG